MTRIQDIVETVRVTEPDEVAAAAQRMKTVSDHDLHFYLVMRDTLSATSVDTRKAIMFAQVEADRRARFEARTLAFTTTFVSGILALVGVFVGAFIAK